MMGLVRSQFESGEEVRRTSVFPQIRLPRPGEFERGSVIPISKWEKFRRSSSEFREKRTEKKILVVGIGGKARHGKDTVAEHIIEKFGQPGSRSHFLGSLDIRSYGFADELKVEVFDFLQTYNFLIHSGTITNHPLSNKANRLCFPSPALALYTRREKIEWVNAWKKELRPILQQHGTEFRRVQSILYWIEKTDQQIKLERPQVALIRDLRFANEAAICDVTVKVERLGYVEQNGNVGKHVSETELDSIPFDYTISVPDGQLGLLKSEAETVFKRILSKWR